MSELADMVRRLRHDREPAYSFNEIEIRKRIEQLQKLYKICSGIHYARIAMNPAGVKKGLAWMDDFFRWEKDDG